MQKLIDESLFDSHLIQLYLIGLYINKIKDVKHVKFDCIIGKCISVFEPIGMRFNGAREN